MASYNDEKFYPLRKMLNTNKKLIEYLSGLDFSGIVLKKAESYSSTMHMSKKGIYKQLTSEYGEGFTDEEAQYAIDHLDD